MAMPFLSVQMRHYSPRNENIICKLIIIVRVRNTLLVSTARRITKILLHTKKPTSNMCI